MSVEVKDLVPGTLFIDFTGQFAVVTGRNPRSRQYPFLYTNKAWRRSRGAVLNGATYKGKLADVKAIVGLVDMDDMKTAQKEAVKTARGPLFGHDSEAEALAEAWEMPSVSPDVLKDVKKGDIILVKHGRSQREVEYMGYKPNRPKYPLQYKIHTGSQYKGKLSSFIRKVRNGVEAAA
jgi:hypothetical protein